jgi:hypothetical protein
MSDRSVTYADARAETIDNTKGTLRKEQSAIKTLLTAYTSHRSANLGNVEPFLRGVMCGLQMGEFAVEDLDNSVMRAPDPAAEEVLDDE